MDLYPFLIPDSSKDSAQAILPDPKVGGIRAGGRRVGTIDFERSHVNLLVPSKVLLSLKGMDIKLFEGDI